MLCLQMLATHIKMHNDGLTLSQQKLRKIWLKLLTKFRQTYVWYEIDTNMFSVLDINRYVSSNHVSISSGNQNFDLYSPPNQNPFTKLSS